MRYRSLAAVLFSLLLPAIATAQNEDRVERWLQNCDGWNNNSSHFCEARNFTLPGASKISVDGRENGGVSFFGWDRNDVKVVALIQATARNDNTAESIAKQVRIETSGGRIHAEGPSWQRGTSWSVSYHVYVPRRSNLQASTQNGGVSVQDVQGEMNFEAMNGGISLANVGGDVRAETTNGGVTASLSGTSWQGRGLDLRTMNGGVNLSIPRGYNAHLETGTTNGGMRVDFPITVQGQIGRRINTQLGSGGAPVRVITTNGGVRISQRQVN